jgi:ferrochelatase
MRKTGVLLMAHGTPSSLDEMPEYLRLVRGGRPASPELVAEMRHNYNAIGGRSPLTEITLAQAAALRSRLGGDIPVSVGMRNWHPFIEDALRDLSASGVRRVVGIPMAPQFSTLSVQKYIDAAQSALSALSALSPSSAAALSAASALSTSSASSPGAAPGPEGFELDPVRSFHTHPLLIDAFAERLRAAAPAEDELVVFTAHSLPARVIEAGDGYAGEVAATARAVALQAGIGHYEVAYQSAGRTPEPWIGPELGAFVRERATAGTRRFLVAPIGFVCDHTEILFDIDVQAAATAREAGAALRRTESLNVSPTFIRVLEDLVRSML